MTSPSVDRIRPIRIANCSGFYGDRISAASEMVDGGPIDVLSGDWLAELTMLILAKNRLRDPGTGYARTFVTQMEQVMGTCLERDIKVVSNAGGLAPRACADAVAAVADRLGLSPTIAYVEGDDLVPRLDELRTAGIDFTHLETGAALGGRDIMTANAYLGGWGIADALGAGADIVVTGRVTDAALTVGPAAWWHGWGRDDWDALAGSVVAGHIIECGPQATGGNYSFFTEIPGLDHPGFPIAEVAGDGSAVITKHPGHGGAVTVGTVTAQLLYEIGGPRYPNPDVTARFDTVTLSQEGPDRVLATGARGESPPATTKVSLNYVGGWRTTVSLALTGLDIEAKAALVEAGLWKPYPGGDRPSPTPPSIWCAPTAPIRPATRRPPPNCGSPSRIPTRPRWDAASPPRSPSWPCPATRACTFCHRRARPTACTGRRWCPSTWCKARWSSPAAATSSTR